MACLAGQVSLSTCHPQCISRVFFPPLCTIHPLPPLSRPNSSRCPVIHVHAIYPLMPKLVKPAKVSKPLSPTSSFRLFPLGNSETIFNPSHPVPSMPQASKQASKQAKKQRITQKRRSARKEKKEKRPSKPIPHTRPVLARLLGAPLSLLLQPLHGRLARILRARAVRLDALLAD